MGEDREHTLTVVGPLPELEIRSCPLGSNVSPAQRESAMAEVLRPAVGHRIVKLPRVAGHECLYLAGGLVRLMRLYDPIGDEITERLDVGFLLVHAEEGQATT